MGSKLRRIRHYLHPSAFRLRSPDEDSEPLFLFLLSLFTLFSFLLRLLSSLKYCLATHFDSCAFKHYIKQRWFHYHIPQSSPTFSFYLHSSQDYFWLFLYTPTSWLFKTSSSHLCFSFVQDDTSQLTVKCSFSLKIVGLQQCTKVRFEKKFLALLKWSYITLFFIKLIFELNKVYQMLSHLKWKSVDILD